MTPPHVIEAINTIAKYLTDEDLGSAVITPGGGASFLKESILRRQNDLYTIIDTMSTAIQAADSTAANVRDILQKVKYVDSVFRAVTEASQKKREDKQC